MVEAKFLIIGKQLRKIS